LIRSARRAADVNWLVWFRLWWLRDRPGWPELWERFLEHGTGMIANLVGQFPEALLASALGTSRTGSNAWAVHARASATGGALLACDPHLPITLPNPWLIAAYRCPSYHVAGLMLPGLPFVAVGRNPWIAWGHRRHMLPRSDLFDLLAGRAGRDTTRVIRVRGARSAEVEIRISRRFGPVISDAVAMVAPMRCVGSGTSHPMRVGNARHQPRSQRGRIYCSG
jgi:penicillin amidase